MHEMAFSITQDLKNQIIGLTDCLLLAEASSKERALSASISRAQKQASAALHGISKLMMCYRIGDFEFDCNGDAVDLTGFVNEIEAAATSFLPPGFGLLVCSDPTLKSWNFDRNLVKLVLDSAINNAIKRGQMAIFLRVQKSLGGLTWCVESKFAGQAPEASTSHQSSAAHLGLGISDAIAIAHKKGMESGHVHLHISKMKTEFSMTLS